MFISNYSPPPLQPALPQISPKIEMELEKLSIEDKVSQCTICEENVIIFTNVRKYIDLAIAY